MGKRCKLRLFNSHFWLNRVSKLTESDVHSSELIYGTHQLDYLTRCDTWPNNLRISLTPSMFRATIVTSRPVGAIAQLGKISTI